MRNNIRLFIGDSEVDFKTAPDIFYNFTEEDLTDPTVVNNSFSKTLTIEGTKNNDKIFGQFWELDRFQVYDGNTGTSFNPSKKTPFTLYVNGELYESGYVKLDAVRRNGQAVEYDITLYGGLGEFFFDISYDDEGNQLSLADLTYMEGGDENEFNLTLTKETLYEAWKTAKPSASRSWKWHYINFAPCYNGYPDNFSADKAVINFNGLTGSTSSETAISNVVSGYTSVQGYALATLPNKLDEWGIRDLRSWCQRPVVRLSGIFEAIERYASAKGYSFDLDPTFFSYRNPYYEDAWITLPLPSEINIQGASDVPAGTAVPVLNQTYTYNGWWNTIFRYGYNPDMPVGTSRIDVDLKFRMYVQPTSQQWFDDIPQQLYTSTYATSDRTTTHRRYGAYAIQLLCFDGTDLNASNIIGGSPAVVLTSKVGEDYLRMNEISSSYWLKYGNDYTYSFGQFNSVGDWYYEWSEALPMSFEVPNNTRAFALAVYAVAPTQADRGIGYISTTCELPERSGDTAVAVYMTHNRNYVTSGTTASGYTSNGTAGFTGAKLTKRLLLSGEHTPADYLLSYAKMFGLHFMKKPNDKVIHIMQRGTFYNSGETIDISDKVDYNSEISINPLSFDTKWYDMSLESVGGEFEEKYQNTYGRTYGIQKINTGFDFNADAKNLFEDSIFKGAVEGTGKNRYYLAPVSYRTKTNVPYVMFQGMTYNLYNGTKSITVDLAGIVDLVPSVALGYDKYYDKYPKLQLCDADLKKVDGKDVLLFYTGDDDNTDYPYYLTDDLPIMGTLNNNSSCWIFTNSETDSGGTRIAYATQYLPRFDRFITNGDSNYHIMTWDFGQPKQLFVPEGVSISGGTVYGRFWQKYLNDLYDVNTRVMRCKIVKDGLKPSPELFRPFYFFENALWRLNSIEDWNIGTDDLGTAEFVKINNPSSYDSKDVNLNPEGTLSVERTQIPQGGATVGGEVTISDGGSWYIEADGGITVEPSQGVGNNGISITFPENTGATTSTTVSLMAGDSALDSVIFTRKGFDFGAEPQSFRVQSGSTQVQLRITDVNNDGWTLSGGTWALPVVTAGTGNNLVTINIEANGRDVSRSQTLTLRNAVNTGDTVEIYVTQEAGARAMPIPASIATAALGGALTVDISDEGDNGWTPYGYPSWVTVSPAQGGVGSMSLTINFSQNTGAERTGTIMIADDNLGTDLPLKISQGAAGGGSVFFYISNGYYETTAVSDIDNYDLIWIIYTGTSESNQILFKGQLGERCQNGYRYAYGRNTYSDILTSEEFGTTRTITVRLLVVDYDDNNTVLREWESTEALEIPASPGSSVIVPLFSFMN